MCERVFTRFKFGNFETSELIIISDIPVAKNDAKVGDSGGRSD